MKGWIAPFLLAAVCLAVGAAATALAEGKGKFVLDRLNALRAPQPPPARPAAAPPGGPGRARRRRGRSSGPRLRPSDARGPGPAGDDGADAKELSGLLDAAREFYRTAHKAYKDGEFDRADEMAHAAEDAAHGILLTLQADAGKLVNVPTPPVVGPLGRRRRRAKVGKVRRRPPRRPRRPAAPAARRS